MCWECFELNQNLTVRPGDDVQAILDRAEPGAVLRFAPGEYRQKLMIRTPGLTLEGAGAEQTALVWDDWAKKLDAEGREYNTFRTWTVAVCADDITMRGLSIINDALNPAEKGQAPRRTRSSSARCRRISLSAMTAFCRTSCAGPRF